LKYIQRADFPEDLIIDNETIIISRDSKSTRVMNWEEKIVKSADAVNSPKHYNSGGIEVIDAIEAWKLDFSLGNAVKYIARSGKKDPNKTKEDLEKAIWYIKRYINRGTQNV